MQSLSAQWTLTYPNQVQGSTVFKTNCSGPLSDTYPVNSSNIARWHRIQSVKLALQRRFAVSRSTKHRKRITIGHLKRLSLTSSSRLEISFMDLGSPKPPCIGPGYRHLENATTFFALAANILLAWLVVKRSNRELRTFKQVLLLGCCTDVLFAITCNLFEIVSQSILVSAQR